MTTKHTPIPWHLEGDYDPIESAWFVLGGGAPHTIKEHAIAAVIRHPGDPIDECKANAAFIIEAVNAHDSLTADRDHYKARAEALRVALAAAEDALLTVANDYSMTRQQIKFDPKYGRDKVIAALDAARSIITRINQEDSERAWHHENVVGGWYRVDSRLQPRVGWCGPRGTAHRLHPHHRRGHP